MRLCALVAGVLSWTSSATAEAEDLPHVTLSQRSPTRLALASCFDQNRIESPIFSRIADFQPQVFLMAGDNVYNDVMTRPFTFAPTPVEVMRLNYHELNSLASYQRIKQSAFVFATWDDHDFGINDGDGSFHLKHMTKELFLDELLEAPATDPRRQRGGVYAAQNFHVGPNVFRVVGLDVRFFKDAWNETAHGTMLGGEQWLWLEKLLCSDRSPRVTIVMSGLQMLMENRGAGESWSRFPHERKRLLELLVKCRVRAPLLVSGDIHMAELLEERCDQGRRRFVELTASGITHSWGTRMNTKLGSVTAFSSLLRFGMTVAKTFCAWWHVRDSYLGLNYGRIELDFDKETVHTAVAGLDGVVFDYEWTFAQLDVGDDGFSVDACEPWQGRPSRWRVHAGMALTVVTIVAGLVAPWAFAWLLLCRRR